MTRYREAYTLDSETLDTVTTYMNDDIREQVHREIAPCTPEKFLLRYIQLDRDFENLLKDEFSIEI